MSRLSAVRLVSVAAIGLVMVVFPPVSARSAPQIGSERLEQIVDYLADPELEGRRAGTPGSRRAADYVLEEFLALGLEASFQPLDETRRNVVARLDPDNVGPAPDPSTPAGGDHVVIGAHYDGQGVGMPGASDNAAGIAVMLALAGEFVANPPEIPVVFVAFDDEEQGLNGSRFYTRNPLMPLDRARAAVILDTMGRSFVDLDQWSLIVMGTERSPTIGGIVEAHSDDETILLGTDLIGARSDFAPFAERNIPFVFFTNATHEDYHGPADLPDEIRYLDLVDDARLVEAVVRDISRLDTAPAFLVDPVYPRTEAADLERVMDLVEAERANLAANYAVLFDDVRRRFGAGPSRVELRLATEILLSAATPRFAFFSLGFTIGPLYEAEGLVTEALAAYREALRLAPDPTTRQLMELKVETLSGDP